MNNNEPVKEYKVLKKKLKSDEALNILKSVASQVKPILVKRGWKISNLCEFFPSNPNLLGTNVNRGWKINIRLRPHFDDSQFLNYGDILGTLLHEMAHIVRGPHDAEFYKLLDELKEETELLMSSGYRGEGFFSEGHQLGQRSIPMHDHRKVAAAAAEKRAALSKVMLPSGGIKLGGSPRNTHLTPAQQAALAAEKRRQDQKWCGSDEHDGYENLKRKQTVDLTLPSSDSKKLKTKEEWSCPFCTFINRPIVLVCEICLKEKPHFNTPIVIEDD